MIKQKREPWTRCRSYISDINQNCEADFFMLVEYLSSPTRARRVLVLLNVLLPLKHKERNWFFCQSLVELPDAVGLNHSHI